MALLYLGDLDFHARVQVISWFWHQNLHDTSICWQQGKWSSFKLPTALCLTIHFDKFWMKKTFWQHFIQINFCARCMEIKDSLDSSLVIFFRVIVALHFLSISYFSECDYSILLSKITPFWYWFLFSFIPEVAKRIQAIRLFRKCNQISNAISSKTLATGLSIYQKMPVLYAFV